jgi:hypothetical protein
MPEAMLEEHLTTVLGSSKETHLPWLLGPILREAGRLDKRAGHEHVFQANRDPLKSPTKDIDHEP